MPVFSLLERLDWSGKKVMTVMTHEGSGLGNSERDLKRICRGASFGPALAVKGAEVEKEQESVKAWAQNAIS